MRTLSPISAHRSDAATDRPRLASISDGRSSSRSAAARSAAALTPSERRIAAMAAEGHSNRAIAQAPFVTLRTVEMHLSNTFRKLGISSRTQLSAALGADPVVT